MAAPNYPLSALYVGDNLEVMRGMNSETVNLIATDPPFNKGVRAFSARDGTASDGASFIDKWEWRDVHADWVEQIRENWTAVHAVIEAAKLAHGYDTAAYLCWLGIRLMECHRILTEDGSIYVHLDDTASAWVKAMMDGIFGRENFRNEILWRRVLGGKSDAGVYGRQTDRLMFYTKSDAFTFTPPPIQGVQRADRCQVVPVQGRERNLLQAEDYRSGEHTGRQRPAVARVEASRPLGCASAPDRTLRE